MDAVIITHNHKDHTQGLLAIFDNFTVMNYIDNGNDYEKDQKKIRDTISARGLATTIRSVFDSEIIALSHKNGLSDNVIDPIECSNCNPEITILAGGMTEDSDWWSSEYQNENNQSLAIRINFGESSALFTGDQHEAALEKMVAYYEDTDMLDVDIYQVGHHGASNATTEEFVAAMTPDIAVVSMGDTEYEVGGQSAWGYGHPRKKILAMIGDVLPSERFPHITERAASKAKVFQDTLITKSIYGTGWEGDVIVRMDLIGIIAIATN